MEKFAEFDANLKKFAEESSAISIELTRQSDELNSLVGQFKVS